MPYKMKGFPMVEGTAPMKEMKEGAMKAMHASPAKAMSPNKKGIAKEKDFNEKPKEREEPLFEGGDITPTQFKNMSIKEIQKLNPDMTIEKIRKIKKNIK